MPADFLTYWSLSVDKYVRGRYTRCFFLLITKKIPTNRAASAATGTKVDKKPERELEVLVWVFEPALEDDWKIEI